MQSFRGVTGKLPPAPPHGCQPKLPKRGSFGLVWRPPYEGMMDKVIGPWRFSQPPVLSCPLVALLALLATSPALRLLG